MIKIIKELNIEVSKPNIFQAVVAKQYDMNTRFIKATLVDGGDVIYIPNDPDRSVQVVINANRPDGLSKGFDGVVNDDGTVTVPLHSWMLEMEGTVICDISVIDTEADDNKKLTTTSFTLLVEKAAYGGDDVTNDPQYDVLVSLLETCQEASAVAEEALAKSNEANSKYDACVEATENANEAADELESIKSELAEGGYVTGLKESNNGGVFKTWIGTQEEYDNLETKIPNCLYMISDDTAYEDLTAKVNNWGSTVYEGNWTPKLINVPTEEGNVKQPTYTMADGSWGYYSRVGNLCFVSCKIIPEMADIGIGWAGIEGLPFKVKCGAGLHLVEQYDILDIDAAGWVSLVLEPGGRSLRFRGSTGAGSNCWKLRTEGTKYPPVLSFSGVYAIDESEVE